MLWRFSLADISTLADGTIKYGVIIRRSSPIGALSRPGYRYWRVTWSSISGGNGSNQCAEAYAYLGASGTGSEIHASATASGTCDTPSTANNGSEGGSSIGGVTGTTLIYTFAAGTDLLSMKFQENTDGGYAQRTYAGTIAKSADGVSYSSVQTFAAQSPTVGSGSYTVTW